GCASTPNPTLSLGSSVYSGANAGLVVGRTIATNDRWIGHRGLRLWFRNTETNEIFSTSSGIVGYTSFEHFAIWLPPGTYTLAGIFAYNGSLGPVSEPLKLSVEKGTSTYVGTLVMSWEIPKDIEKLGRPVSIKQHGRLQCPSFFACDVFAPNPGIVDKPFADVAIFDEGAAFLEGLKAEVPQLPPIPFKTGLMR
ncbi:MAG: hypothetical protein Q8J65_05260, partial [Nitrosomonadales bacterium]|nr:hypothetical protein [Nitrosomonadales bacterium]